MSRIRKTIDQVFVQPETDIVSTTADDFREELMDIFNQNHADIVVDLSRVSEVDSVGLGVFIAAYNTLAKREKKFKVINASSKIFSLFQIMGLARRFAVAERKAKA